MMKSDPSASDREKYWQDNQRCGRILHLPHLYFISIYIACLLLKYIIDNYLRLQTLKELH